MTYIQSKNECTEKVAAYEDITCQEKQNVSCELRQSVRTIMEVKFTSQILKRNKERRSKQSRSVTKQIINQPIVSGPGSKI